MHPNGCFSNPGFLVRQPTTSRVVDILDLPGVVVTTKPGVVCAASAGTAHRNLGNWLVQQLWALPNEGILPWGDFFWLQRCGTVEGLLFWISSMVNHQTRLPFGEYVVLIFANYQTCKSKTIMSWIQPTHPQKNHSPISSSSAGGELLALFVWLPIVKFRQDFHQQYLHIVGIEKAENSCWQLDWIRLLHLNKTYGKKSSTPKTSAANSRFFPGSCWIL